MCADLYSARNSAGRIYPSPIVTSSHAFSCARRLVDMYLLRALIGSLCSMRLLLSVRQIAFVFVLRHLMEKISNFFHFVNILRCAYAPLTIIPFAHGGTVQDIVLYIGQFLVDFCRTNVVLIPPAYSAVVQLNICATFQYNVSPFFLAFLV